MGETSSQGVSGSVMQLRSGGMWWELGVFGRSLAVVATTTESQHLNSFAKSWLSSEGWDDNTRSKSCQFVAGRVFHVPKLCVPLDIARHVCWGTLSGASGVWQILCSYNFDEHSKGGDAEVRGKGWV